MVYKKWNSIEERFWSKVNKTDSCWLWIASKNPSGYGLFNMDGRSKLAHRVSLKLSGIEFDDSLYALHHCDTPACVNPSHIFLGTQAMNMEDMNKKGRGSIKGFKNGCGSKHGNALLTEDQVLEIRRKYQPKKYTLKMLANEYGIAITNVSAIVNRKSWTHI